MKLLKQSIYFFISSTFKDFQTERNILQNEVERVIDQYTRREYGLSSFFIDLRWGIDTSFVDEETAILKTLQFCANEINHSYPFFIILKGDTYGTLVNEKFVKSIYQNEEVKTHGICQKSITEIEFDIRARKHLDYDQILYYQREIISSDIPVSYYETEDDKIKLNNRFINTLNEVIPRDNIKRYQAKFVNQELVIEDNFKQMIIIDIKKCINSYLRDLVNFDSPFDSIFESKKQFLLNTYDKTIAREKSLSQVKERISINRFIAIIGEAGMGKTSFLAHIYHHYCEEKDVIMFLVKHLQTKSTIDYFFDYINYHLEKILEQDHEIKSSYEDKVSYLYELANKTKTDKDIIILIDDINFLSQSANKFAWLNKRLMPNHFKIICTFNSESEANVSNLFQAFHIYLEPYQDEEIKNVLITSGRYYRKEFSNECLNLITTYLKQNENFRLPVYFASIINSLMYIRPAYYHKMMLDLETKSYHDALFSTFDTILKETPLTLEELIKMQLSGLILDNPNYSYLLCILYFTQYEGLSIDLQKSVSELSENKIILPDFIQLKYYLNSFIETISSDYFKVSNSLLMNIIKEIIPEAIMDEIAQQLLLYYTFNRDLSYTPTYILILEYINNYSYLYYYYISNDPNMRRIEQAIFQIEAKRKPKNLENDSIVFSILKSAHQNDFVFVKYYEAVIMYFIGHYIAFNDECYLNYLQGLLHHLNQKKDTEYQSLYVSNYLKTQTNIVWYYLNNTEQVYLEDDFSNVLIFIEEHFVAIDVNSSGIIRLLDNLLSLNNHLNYNFQKKIEYLLSLIEQKDSNLIQSFYAINTRIKQKRNKQLNFDEDYEKLVQFYHTNKDQLLHNEKIDVLTAIIANVRYQDERFRDILLLGGEGYKLIYDSGLNLSNEERDIELRARFTANFALRLYNYYLSFKLFNQVYNEDSFTFCHDVSRNSLTEAIGLYKYDQGDHNTVQFVKSVYNHMLISLDLFDDNRYIEEVFDFYCDCLKLELNLILHKNKMVEHVIKILLVGRILFKKYNKLIDVSSIINEDFINKLTNLDYHIIDEKAFNESMMQIQNIEERYKELVDQKYLMFKENILNLFIYRK